jgi:hypothetical protein
MRIWKNPIFRITLAAVAFCGIFWLWNATMFSRNNVDDIAIYQAVIRYLYLDKKNYDKSLYPVNPTLYILRATDDEVVADLDFNDPWLYWSLLKPKKSVFLSETIQQSITSSLTDLQTKIVWINNLNDAYSDNWGDYRHTITLVIWLGNIHYENGNNKASVSGSITILRGLSTRGYNLEKKNGIWIVTDTTYERNMSE